MKYYRRFYRWLIKRYYSENRTGARPTATARLAWRDPLFWLWVVLAWLAAKARNVG